MTIKHDKLNWDECCSCCPVLDRRLKIAKKTIKILNKQVNLLTENNELHKKILKHYRLP